MAVFLAGTKRRLFRELGIKYGFIAVEDCGMLMVICLEQGQEALKHAVEKEKVSADEAKRIEKAMVKAGFAKDLKTVFKKMCEEFAPEHGLPVYGFKPCGCSVSVPHGDIVDKDGESVQKIFTLSQGMMYLAAAVEEGKMSVIDATTVFRAMTAARLLEHEDDVVKAAGITLEQMRGGGRVVSATIISGGPGVSLKDILAGLD